MARVAVMVHTMAFLVTWKWAASVSTRKTTTKKSNASRVQPRKLAVTACHWPDLEGGTSCSGLEIEAVSFSSFLGTVTGKCTTRRLGLRRRQCAEGSAMKAANGRLTTRQAGKYAAVRTAAPIFFLQGRLQTPRRRGGE